MPNTVVVITKSIALSIALYCVASIAACANGPSEFGRSPFQIVGGTPRPDDGFRVDEREQNAVVAQIATFGTIRTQGCSGTLVGDRVVVVAGHCVLLNLYDWTMGKAPEVATPALVSYVVGPDIDKPLCEFKARSIALHPRIAIMAPDPKGTFDAVLVHDVALVVLETSALDTCKHVKPLHMPRDVLSSDIVGQEVLHGGYGAKDGSENFSHTRLWSSLKVDALRYNLIVTKNIGKGFTAKGDSGAGALIRFPDGALYNLGVASIGTETLSAFVRLDKELDFIDSVVTRKERCGPLESSGRCDGQVALNCVDSGISWRDCGKEGLACRVDKNARALCGSKKAPSVDAGTGVGAEGQATDGRPVDEGGGCALGTATRPLGGVLFVPLLLLLFWAAPKGN